MTLLSIMSVPVVGLALVACAGSDQQAGDNASTDASTPSLDSADLGPCPDRTLCLVVTEVEPDEPLASGHLVVVWRQLLDVNGLEEMPKLAYDTPFEPGAARYEIPLTSLSLPDDNQLLCQWDSEGCHRDAPPRAVGFGYVMVVQDDNGDGFLEDVELSPYSASGAAFAYVAWSEDARAPGSDDLTNFDGSPNYLGQIFPDGIRAGINPYDTTPADGFEFALTPLGTGVNAELAVCPATAQCSVTIPRLVGMQYP